jgi:hypothetical protein
MTGDVTVDTVVNDYLWRVGSALGGVPPARAREITNELAEHIREAREDGAVVSLADARNLLDRLGEPADIAAEAERRFGRLARPRAGAREIFAILLLGVGGVLIPFVGWMIGIVLLWTSEGWNRRDKVLGTVLTLGALPGFALLLAVPSTGTAVGSVTDPSGRVISTQVFSSGPPAFVGPLVLTVVLVLPILTAVYLLVQLRVARRPVAPNG